MTKVAGVAVTALLIALNLRGAQNVERLQFAAASILPSGVATTVVNGVEVKFSPGRFTAKNAQLKDLIVSAYRLPYWRVVVGSGWTPSNMAALTERYNIEAVAEDRAGADQLRLMLQTLLADRFKLAVHRDYKPDQDVYNLMVAKDGPKFQEVKVNTYTGTRRSGGGRLSTEQMKMADLADWLAVQLETSVYDKTGLLGIYKFDLVFTPDDLRTASASAEPPRLHVSGERAIDPSNGPSLLRALQEQLGLKLVWVKGPLEILVIDHAEKPGEN